MVGLDGAVVAGGEAAVAVQQGEGLLHRPALVAQARAVLGVAAGDP